MGCPVVFFFFTDPPTTEFYTLSLHDALPISRAFSRSSRLPVMCSETTPSPSATTSWTRSPCRNRSEEHTSELQSQFHLVCRLLLEKKKKKSKTDSFN